MIDIPTPKEVYTESEMVSSRLTYVLDEIKSSASRGERTTYISYRNRSEQEFETDRIVMDLIREKGWTVSRNSALLSFEITP